MDKYPFIVEELDQIKPFPKVSNEEFDQILVCLGSQ